MPPTNNTPGPTASGLAEQANWPPLPQVPTREEVDEALREDRPHGIFRKDLDDLASIFVELRAVCMESVPAGEGYFAELRKRFHFVRFVQHWGTDKIYKAAKHSQENAALKQRIESLEKEVGLLRRELGPRRSAKVPTQK